MSEINFNSFVKFLISFFFVKSKIWLGWNINLHTSFWQSGRKKVENCWICRGMMKIWMEQFCYPLSGSLLKLFNGISPIPFKTTCARFRSHIIWEYQIKDQINSLLLFSTGLSLCLCLGSHDFSFACLENMLVDSERETKKLYIHQTSFRFPGTKHCFVVVWSTVPNRWWVGRWVWSLDWVGM